MTWRRFATLIEWVRHPTSVILAIVIAFQRTMAFRSERVFYQPSLRALSRHFMFWGAICLVLFAVGFTALLVFAETRAKRAEERERIPEARVLDRQASVEPVEVARETAPAPVRALTAPIIAPPPPPVPAPTVSGDEPSLLK
jgi:hypothetical protein